MDVHFSHVGEVRLEAIGPASSRRQAFRRIGAGLFGIACALYLGTARADLNDPKVLAQLNPLERLAAKANQAVYNALTAPGTGSANGAPICDPTLGNTAPTTGRCTGNVYKIFARVRELVDTANVIGNSTGPRLYTLGLDARGLGLALRWTAAEELSAQGTASTEFSNGQINSLANRIAALRFGAFGFRVALNNDSSGGASTYSTEDHTVGGAAGADGEALASPWGGFLNGSYGYGRKSDTTNLGAYEDAFAFDGADLSGGVDYRFGPHYVLGGMLGYSKRRIDFDSTQSTTDGRIRSNGESLMVYGLWETDEFFMSGSVGWQRLNHDFVRRISYPSLNPLVSSVNETAGSSTHSNALLATLTGGYDFRLRALTVEPYLKMDYQGIKIAAFTEAGANGFDFNYGEQTIKSLDGAFGLKLQYVFTPRFGVIVPYFRGEIHKEFDDKQRLISAEYAALASVGLANAASVNFDIPSDKRKNSFGVLAGGFSLVFKHGLQAFAQYEQVVNLPTIASRTISGGIRYEF
jgi:outer membrane autotransporter protein